MAALTEFMFLESSQLMQSEAPYLPMQNALDASNYLLETSVSIQESHVWYHYSYTNTKFDINTV